MGYAATMAISTIDGETIRNASRFWESPRERALAGGWIEAASAIGLEARQRLRDLGLRVLHRGGRIRLARERLVDVLVDGLGDLRIHRRHRTRLGLRHGLQKLLRERQGLLDGRVVVDRLLHRG